MKRKEAAIRLQEIMDREQRLNIEASVPPPHPDHPITIPWWVARGLLQQIDKA